MDWRLGIIAGHYGRSIGRDGRIRIPCPAHGGEHDSLSLWAGEDGIGAKCFSRECPFGEIATAIEQATGVSFRANRKSRRGAENRHVDHVWEYEHPDGRRKKVYRQDSPKRIWQEAGKLDGFHVLLLNYRPGQPVVLVEGEKAAEAIAAAGLTGCSYIGGSKNAGKADYGKLAGEDVVVWPDRDKPGRMAAVVCIEKCDGAGANVRLVPQQYWDGADAADCSQDEIHRAIADAVLPEALRECINPERNRAGDVGADFDELSPFDASIPIGGCDAPHCAIRIGIAGCPVSQQRLRTSSRYGLRGVA